MQWETMGEVPVVHWVVVGITGVLVVVDLVAKVVVGAVVGLVVVERIRAVRGTSACATLDSSIWWAISLELLLRYEG